MYIDRVYYLGNGGTEMDDAAFSRNEYRSRKILDRVTQNRITKMAQVPEAVKRLMVELVTLEATQGASVLENQPVTSFSNDGYSEKYAQPMTAEMVRQLEMDLIVDYLAEETDDNGTPLLYLGVRQCNTQIKR